MRWIWTQITSMRTALFLLMLLAIAAVPGSLVPQRSSDPNGVDQFRANNPDVSAFLDAVQGFDVYFSPWFSSIYLLLFISLVGCIIPRVKHHLVALGAKPPPTPLRLSRLPGFTTRTIPLGAIDAAGLPVTRASAIDAARSVLRKAGYRTVVCDESDTLSVSAERGYLRETGNLVFHGALVGILIAVGFGGGFGYNGQRVVVEGETFVNALTNYDSFNPGRFFRPETLAPFALTLDSLSVEYEYTRGKAFGQPIDFTARAMQRSQDGHVRPALIKVNDPLAIGGANVYLLGNGYAPTITVRRPDGTAVFSGSVPFLPQDANLTSLGVVKIPDGLAEQVGMIGFFYPTAQKLPSGAFASSFPDLVNPLLTLTVYAGDLGLNSGAASSVYSLKVDKLASLAGGPSGTKALELRPGETVDLPSGLGTVTLENHATVAPVGDGNPAQGTANRSDNSGYSGSVPRFASLDVRSDPATGWVLFFAILVLGGLLTSLFVPRRRVWVKLREGANGAIDVEYAGLARGDDPGLVSAVAAIAQRHLAAVGAVVSEASPSNGEEKN